MSSLSDEELDAHLSDSSTIIYTTVGGLVVVAIEREEIPPKCVADVLRAMATRIEKNGIPKTLTEIRCHLLN